MLLIFELRMLLPKIPNSHTILLELAHCFSQKLAQSWGFNDRKPLQWLTISAPSLVGYLKMYLFVIKGVEYSGTVIGQNLFNSQSPSLTVR